MSTFAKVTIDKTSISEAEALLTKIDFELRTKVLEQGLRASAKPVAERAREYAPDSARTSHLRNVAKHGLAAGLIQNQRPNHVHHKDTIGLSTVRNYGSLVAIYVGPIHPKGNLINVIGHPHQQVVFGRRTGRIIPPNKYLERAGTSTETQQRSIFVEKVTSGVNRLLRRKK